MLLKLSVLFSTCLFANLSGLSLQAADQSGQVLVEAVSGTVQYSLDDVTWKPLPADISVPAGATIKTAEGSTADLMLLYNGSVLRLTPNSKLRLEKLLTQKAGEETVTDTRLKLLEGTLVGSQRKLHKPSQLAIATPGATAVIMGTEYVVNASGAVSVLSGTVSVNYNLPGNGGDIKVTVLPGQSFDPATGTVVPTNPTFLQDLIAHIDTVKRNAEVFKTGGATIVVKNINNEPVSPTHGQGGNDQGQNGNGQGQNGNGQGGNSQGGNAQAASSSRDHEIIRN
jgi:hypothetical protein